MKGPFSFLIFIVKEVPLAKFTKTVLILGLFISITARSEELKPFCSDTCTSYTEGTQENPTAWRHCCIRHDFLYWKGGTKEERLRADQELRSCVRATGNPLVARIMYRGVRIFGGPGFPTSYRWGYGWSRLRPYGAFSPEEAFVVDQLSPEDPEAVPLCTNAEDL